MTTDLSIPEDWKMGPIRLVEDKPVMTVGFAIDNSARVALIQKARPEWQAGRLNGIGGHVEVGETPHDAMVREFEEETGVTVPLWQHMVEMQFDGGTIHFYRAYVRSATLNAVHQTTDEPVVVIDHRAISRYQHIPNLDWLLPLAFYTADTYETILVQASAAEALG